MGVAEGQTKANSTITQLGEGASSGWEAEIERQNSKPSAPSSNGKILQQSNVTDVFMLNYPSVTFYC